MKEFIDMVLTRQFDETEYVSEENVNSITSLCMYINHATMLLRKNVFPKEVTTADANDYLQFTKFETQIFSLLKRKGCGLTPTEIARSLNVSNQRLTYPINKLVHKGFLKRVSSADNKKVVYIMMTPMLVDIAQRFNDKMEGITKSRLDSCLTDGEQEELCEALKTVTEIMSKVEKKRLEVKDTGGVW
ncbi:MAG: MarR family transcriptional regulator [Clostridia bacterium]|nr:MarR family transcriptional regulator [Clostridia bacterium]